MSATHKRGYYLASIVTRSADDFEHHPSISADVVFQLEEDGARGDLFAALGRKLVELTEAEPSQEGGGA